jgi:hypothetical protein
MRVLLALALTAPVAANWGQCITGNPSGTYQTLLAVLHSPGLELVVRARRLGLLRGAPPQAHTHSPRVLRRFARRGGQRGMERAEWWVVQVP